MNASLSKWFVVLVAVLFTIWPASAQEPIVPENCTISVQQQEKILVCVPTVWNGDLVVYAHGYIPPQEPLQLPIDELTMEDGTFVPSILMQLGYAFATTSYSTNGYAVREGAEDLNALVLQFKEQYSQTRHVFITGGSEGGLITTMLIEKYPENYTGGLAMCGPLAGMPYQVKYFGDFRVVFDYFFPYIFDFGFADVPENAWLNWENYQLDIASAIANNPGLTDQLFNVVKVAKDSDDAGMNSAVEAAQKILAYSILGYNDMKSKAGGNPYGNCWTWYWGSENDWRLNMGVERVRASWRAKRFVSKYYETTGKLEKPLVTLHTTDDPIVPYRHELIYLAKVLKNGSFENFVAIPAFNYGHCTFTTEQVMGAFAILVWKSTGEVPVGFLTYLEMMQ